MGTEKDQAGLKLNRSRLMEIRPDSFLCVIQFYLSVRHHYKRIAGCDLARGGRLFSLRNCHVGQYAKNHQDHAALFPRECLHEIVILAFQSKHDFVALFLRFRCNGNGDGSVFLTFFEFNILIGIIKML